VEGSVLIDSQKPQRTFFGFFSSKDDFCFEMLKYVAGGIDPRHYVPRLVWWNFPKEN
jgi:hypothetical protein